MIEIIVHIIGLIGCVAGIVAFVLSVGGNRTEKIIKKSIKNMKKGKAAYFDWEEFSKMADEIREQ